MFGTHNTNLPQRANVFHNHSYSHSHSYSRSHSRPDTDTLLRAKDIQSITETIDNDFFLAGSNSPKARFAGKHSALCLSVDDSAARSQSRFFMQTPLHCSIVIRSACSSSTSLLAHNERLPWYFTFTCARSVRYTLTLAVRQWNTVTSSPQSLIQTFGDTYVHPTKSTLILVSRPPWLGETTQASRLFLVDAMQSSIAPLRKTYSSQLSRLDHDMSASSCPTSVLVQLVHRR
jgi:hypothetical protein